jgi:hypothetical protein
LGAEHTQRMHGATCLQKGHVLECACKGSRHSRLKGCTNRWSSPQAPLHSSLTLVPTALASHIHPSSSHSPCGKAERANKGEATSAPPTHTVDHAPHAHQKTRPKYSVCGVCKTKQTWARVEHARRARVTRLQRGPYRPPASTLGHMQRTRYLQHTRARGWYYVSL